MRFFALATLAFSAAALQVEADTLDEFDWCDANLKNKVASMFDTNSDGKITLQELKDALDLNDLPTKDKK